MIDPSAFVHPHAHVEDSAVGARTKIWQFASVIRGAEVGEDCSIGDGAIVDGARIGDRCLIGHGSAINPGVVIGEDVFVGPQVVFCNDAWPRISKDGFAIALFASGFVTVRVSRGASIGAAVVILPGMTIGEGAMIAAGAVVDRNVPARMLFGRDGEMRALDLTQPRHRMREAL